MRTMRIIAVLVGLTFVGVSQANVATAEARALPEHTVFATGKEIGNTNKFIAFGRVPTFKGGKIAIQRKNCGTCRWQGYKKIRTRASDGHFRTGIAPGQKVPSHVCYRVNVPATKDYRRTKSMIGCIDTHRT